ncbi:NAD-glutamate dehydrogenase [Nocardioides ferulae]|uniref:NAD-glutamate dehydrogenase n=1 Tax=Nocardioides ferulae TaxID=2340821 RepID=UPI000EAF05AE|nr:NAD-glutamate dehydrogenase [Nocardioides ferulae]
MSTTTPPTQPTPQTLTPQQRAKVDLVRAAVRLAGDDAELAGLVDAFYRHVAPEDIAGRDAEDLLGAVRSHRELAQERPQGTARVRVVAPTKDGDGWSAAGRSVVEVVVDDMPFLVDSLTMEMARERRSVHVVVHPVIDVERDIAGAMRSARPVLDGARPPHSDAVRESWMHLEVDRIRDAGSGTGPDDVAQAVQKVLRDVRESVEDWGKMHERISAIVHELAQTPPPLPAEEVRQGRELLSWLAADHFAFLGYREYALERDGDAEVLRARPGSGLGILRSDPDLAHGAYRLPTAAADRAREKTLLVLTKANSRSTVHRPAYLDYVGVKTFGADGEVTGERRFLGLFSSTAYTESVVRIPLLREKVREVLERSGFDPLSHDGKALVNTLETWPRDELFHTPVDELTEMAEAASLARERRAVRLFLRPDTYGRYVSAIVYLPRDRYNTGVRERFASLLVERLQGETIDYTARLDESTTARVHFVVHLGRGTTVPKADPELVSELESDLAAAARSWRDAFANAVVDERGEEVGVGLARRYAESFPEAYKEDFDPTTAVADVGRLESIDGDEGLDLALTGPVDAERGQARLKVYRIGTPLSLSRMLPMLASMGVEVVDERPYELTGLERPTFVYEFGLRYAGSVPREAGRQFEDALHAVWSGHNEVDGFNALVLAAGLNWRQVTVLRAYARYLRQGGTPFSMISLQDALRHNVDLAALLVRLFEARFDPGERSLPADAEARQTRVEHLRERIAAGLDDVASLDHDRILRSYLALIEATLRTNFYQRAEDGGPKPYLSVKLDPSAVPDLPEPRPKFEIFVYSPRVEGVHLRFGSVARGGLRWSDRRDDYRTEVLGLVKAQMVKNTVIVPVGAKGGFYCRHLPDPSDRDAWMAEGVACYRSFISGLLDVTDNLVDGETVPPPRVVRHDGDDSYLVVAADKGTASFSDIANEVAASYGFWLGDAFASGGSAGYDHKAMGITARGAWVSVQRHFRERGIDCQREDFTAVGIGDMSGDVFGNGMLCSEHIRLVAAFDHRDIFLDPDPDAATSFAERKRLFELPRSSWADYDSSLISEGGGVWSRQRKSIPLNDAVRRALGIDDGVQKMAPTELMRAILRAPVDLLWNGGIGTYVKASTETNADVGDKAGDAIRVDGRELRTRCVGEGGNLGFTQLGRIEYARTGGRINTDFIDNSAGVDTSDHEVNLKILLDRVVKEGELRPEQRDSLLAEMTDEVAALVLRDNYEQNLALANAAAHAPAMLHVHEDWMRRLERDGVLDRDLEGLPSRKEVRRRLEQREGLTVPELSVLLAWTKITLAERLLDSDQPDDPFLRSDLFAYFPSHMRQGYRPQMETHPLRREIIVTQIVNDLVNGAGITFWPRLAAESGAGPAELTIANFVAREIFGSLVLRDELASYDNRLDAAVQTRMRLEMRTLVERGSRWLVANRRPPLDSDTVVDAFEVPVQRAMAQLPELMTGRELAAFHARRDALVEQGVPEQLATRVAVLPPAYMLLSIVEVARREGLDPEAVARVHFALGERLGLPTLVQRILALPRQDRWQAMARAALRDDLHAVHSQLTAAVLAHGAADDPAPARVAAWEEHNAVVVGRAAATLEEICTDEAADLARMSVGLRVVRGLLENG